MSEKRKDIPDSDSFWDLGKAPSRVAHTSDVPSASSTNAVEIDVGQSGTRRGYTDLPLTSTDSGTITRFVNPKVPSSDKKLLYEYTPKNPLITSVKVYTDAIADSIFSKDNLFLRERRALLERTGKPTASVPYYSLMPRYSNMNRAQLNFYLWWRENIRQGIWLEADLSYALLYAHELIADDTASDKDSILRALCKLYCAQVNDKQLSFYGIGTLICDFCLLYDLRPRPEYLADRYSELVSMSGTPEIFIDLSDRSDSLLYGRMLDSCSYYSYKKSKHYKGNEEIFDRAMHGAMRAILESDAAYEALTAFSQSAYGLVRAGHKPFMKIQGLTCSHARLEISYHPISFLSNIITDAVRYTENKLREHLGIRSKLNITTVNPEVRAAIDRYMSAAFPPPSRESIKAREQKRAEEEYSRLYDVPRTELSLEAALDIERQSWETTRVLVEAFEDSSTENSEVHTSNSFTEDITHAEAVTVMDTPSVETSALERSASEIQSQDITLLDTLSHALGDAAEFLYACIRGDIPSQRRCASTLGVSLDELADRVNELALESLGDILLEDNGEGYVVIEDYKPLLD